MISLSPFHDLPSTVPPEDQTITPVSSLRSHMSKSTNTPQKGTHRAPGGSIPQGRPSYETTARTAPSGERLDNAAGASFPAIGTSAPSQPSGRRDHRPTSNEAIAVPSAASTGHRATVERRDTSQFNVEQSLAGQVSTLPRSTPVALRYSLSRCTRHTEHCCISHTLP